MYVDGKLVHGYSSEVFRNYFERQVQVYAGFVSRIEYRFDDPIGMHSVVPFHVVQNSVNSHAQRMNSCEIGALVVKTFKGSHVTERRPEVLTDVRSLPSEGVSFHSDDADRSGCSLGIISRGMKLREKIIRPLPSTVENEPHSETYEYVLSSRRIRLSRNQI